MYKKVREGKSFQEGRRHHLVEAESLGIFGSLPRRAYFLWQFQLTEGREPEYIGVREAEKGVYREGPWYLRSSTRRDRAGLLPMTTILPLC